MKQQYNVIGLMSGTSLDGLDLVYSTFLYENTSWKYTIKKTKSITYSKALQEDLKNTTTLDAASLLAFNNTFGTFLGNQVAVFIKENKLNVDFVASHGHTVFHQPERGLTYQIGSGQHLANRCLQKVVCDFRTNDVALGGQGAPLVPIGDKLLFSDYVFCLNLGGISNISFDDASGNRVAFDISPVNMLLSHITQKIHLPYDDGGKIAASGTLNNKLLESLNSLAYYKQPYPKSLGIEWFQEHVIPIIDSCQDTVENLLHTSVHHIAQQIANVILQHNKNTSANILTTGGGAYNTFLIETLKQYLKDRATVVVPSKTLIEFKEALVFGFMGVLRIENKINCLQSVTGASKDSSSGVIFYPSKTE